MSSRASLNHIYRTVWNEALQVMVAVAEIASSPGGSAASGGTNTHRRNVGVLSVSAFAPLALALAGIFAAAPSAMAQTLPTGGVALHGQAAISKPAPNQMTVTTQNGAGTNHSAINWQSFSIGAGASANFVQPNAASTSINRVVTNTPSALFGNLSSNGKLVLVNQAGIAVGAGAMIDTAGFTASTLRMTDADALAGRLRYGDAGSALGSLGITVDGRITASNGDVVLIAPNIDVGTSAFIKAPNGSTVLAAGQQVEITGRGLEGITMLVQAPENAARNLGSLQGNAVGIFAGTLRHSGEIQATAASLEGGKVVLKAMGDTLVEGAAKIVATGTKGGSVDVLGNRVAVADQASIDVSGTTGGGTIRVGGDYQGKNADVPNAQMNYIGPEAMLRADATGSGDGGKVIVWADDATRAYGSIAANAAAGGAGGFVETSGHNYLDVAGIRVTVAGSLTRPGNWLLDPSDITITHGVAASSYPTVAPGNIDSTTSAVGSGTLTTFFPTASAGTSTLTDGDLNTFLSNNNNLTLTLQTSNSPSGSGSGDITFNGSSADILVSRSNNTNTNANALILNADRNIVFSGGTTTFERTSATASGHSLTVQLNPGVTNSSGKIITDAGTTVVLSGTNDEVSLNIKNGRVWDNAGTVTMNGLSVIRLPNESGYATFNNLGTGTLNVNASSPWSFLSDSGTQGGILNNAGIVNINGTSNGGIGTAWEAKYAQTAGAMNIGAGKYLSMQNGILMSGALDIGSGGLLAVNEQHAGALQFTNTAFSGAGRVQITSAVTANFNSTTGTLGALDVLGTAIAVGGSFSVGDYTQSAGTFGGSASVVVGNSFSKTGGLFVPSGPVSITQASGNLTLNDALNVSAVTLAAPTGILDINSALTISGAVNLSARDGLSIDAPITGATFDASLTGASGVMAVNRAVSASGAMNLTLAGGLSLHSSLSTNATLAAGANQNISAKYVEVISSGSSSAAISTTVGSQTITTSGVNGSGEGLVVNASSSSPYNAEIKNTATGGVQNITVNNADHARVTGLTSTAQITSTGSQSITLQGTGANFLHLGGTTATGNSSISGQGQTITAGQTSQAGGIELLGGVTDTQNAEIINHSGDQTISTTGTLSLFGGAASGVSASTGCYAVGACAMVTNSSSGTQNITANGFVLQGGAGGGFNAATIRNSSGNQVITAGAGGISMTGGSGSGSSNYALIEQSGTLGATQSVTVNGGGSITLTGGSSAGTPSNSDGSFALIESKGESQTLTLVGGGNIDVTGGTVGKGNIAEIYADQGLQTVSGATLITLRGGASGGGAGGDLSNSGAIDIDGGSQNITAGGIRLFGGAGGNQNVAALFSSGNQTINVGSGGLQLTGGGGNVTDRVNGAVVYQAGGAGTSQTITVSGGGAVTLLGGTSPGLAVGFDSVFTDVSAGTPAAIVAHGDSQLIEFTAAGGSISATGGTVGSNNYASIEAAAGTQTVRGTSVANAPTLSLTAGSNGVTNEGNHARITSNTGVQTLNLATTTLNSGAGGGTDNAAIIVAPQQFIAVQGNLLLQGGTGVSSNGGARIGGRLDTNTDLSLTVSGNLLVTAAANSVSLGGSPDTTSTSVTTVLDVLVGGDAIFTPSATAAVRIGSPASNVRGGQLNLTAGGDMAFNSAGGSGYVALRTAGDIGLSARTVTEAAGTVVLANVLSVVANAGATLNVSGNQTTSMNVSNSTSGDINITQAADATLSLAGISQGGSGAVNLSADDLALNGAISAPSGSVSITQVTLSRGINIESNASTGALSLTPAELALVTADSLSLGRSDSTGSMTLNAAVAALSVGTLNLYSGGNILTLAGTDWGSAASPLNTSLQMQASGNVQLTGSSFYLADNRFVSIVADQDSNGIGNVSIDASTVKVGKSSGNTSGDMSISGVAVGVRASGGASTLLRVEGTASQAFNATQGVSVVNNNTATGTLEISTAGGTQQVTAGVLLTVGAGTGTGTSTTVASGGNQVVNTQGIEVTGGASGGGTNTGNFAVLSANGNQDLTVGALGISVEGGGGTLSDNYATIWQRSATGNQNIAVSGGIDVLGGTSSGSGAGGLGHGSFAAIQSNGLTQNITLSGGALQILGGDNGSRNLASIWSATGNQNISGASSITLQGGSSGGVANAGNSADISASAGTQSVSATTITVQGGSGGAENYAQIFSQGNQTLNASTLALTGGAGGGGSGTGNTAVVRSNASQSITVGAGGLSLYGGGGSLSDNAAMVLQEGTAGTSQTITINNGSDLTMQGGASTATNVGGSTHGSRALIESLGDSQLINFGAAGSDVQLTGGSAGSRAFAQIYAENGSQTITGANALIMTGGSGGGFAGEGNFAGIVAAAGVQTITAGATTLNGGASGIENSAHITAGTQALTLGGNLALNGGGASNSGARIGGTSTSNTNLNLQVAGDIAIAAGSVSGAGIGSSTGGVGQTNDITVHATGGLTFTPSGTRGTRIGSTAADVAAGTISVSADSGILFGSSGTVGTAAIRTLGDVNLTSSGGTIIQSSEAVILANRLTTQSASHSALLGANTVARLDASTTGGDVAFYNTQALVLGNINSSNDLSITTGGNGAITQAAGTSVIAHGPTTLDAGTGDITLTAFTNDFMGMVAATGGTVRIRDANSIALDGFLVSALVVQAAGDLTLVGDIEATGTGDAVALVSTAGTLDADIGSITTPNGRWLAYLATPVGSNYGGLTTDFKQYNATLGSTVLGTGNGLLFGLSPTVTASLGTSTTASKVYDGNTIVDVSSSAIVVSASGAQAGDTVNLIKLGSGALDTRNVGTGKSVSVGVQIGSVTSGAIPVYGYTFQDTGTVTSSVAGAIGVVTPASITAVNGITASKTYDGNSIATSVDTSSASFTGMVAGDNLGLSAGSGSFSDRNVGTGKSLSANALALTGTDAGNYTLGTTTASGTGTIVQRLLATWSGSGGNALWSNALNWDYLPDGANVATVSIPGGTGSVTMDVAGVRLLGLTSARPVTQTSTGSFVTTLLSLDTQGGIALTNAANQISGLTATNSGSGDIVINNSTALSIRSMSNTAGSILVDNLGAVNTSNLVKASGDVVIAARSPLAVGVGGITAGNNINLAAGTATNPGVADNLSIFGPLNAGNTVTLFAGNNLVQNSAVYGANGVTATALLGKIAYGLGATTDNTPVLYTEGGLPVTPPPRSADAAQPKPDPGPTPPPGPGPALTQEVAALAEIGNALAEQQQNNDKDKDKKKDQDAIVTEGEVCK